MKNRTINNKLLRLLPSESLDLLLPCLDFVELTSGETIDHVNRPIDHLYFVNRGVISLVKVMRDGRSVEVGAVGIEGITDPIALFGIDDAVIEAMVQVPGNAFRVGRKVLSSRMAEDAALRDLMQRYARFAYGQLVQTAACNRLHMLTQRACRWILTTHDSALADSFSLTHEFMAMMLGVPRSSVTLAVRELREAGFISYSRGRMNVIDRAGLRDASCECYFENIAEMKRLFGSIPPDVDDVPNQG